MRRPTEEELTVVDAAGTPYPPRGVASKLLDTTIRTLILVAALYAIGLGWEWLA
jgi:hypothetical protein